MDEIGCINKLRLTDDSCLQMVLHFTAESCIQTPIWLSNWPAWWPVRSAAQMACMARMWEWILAWIIAFAFLFQFLHCGAVALGENSQYLCSASVLQDLFSLILTTKLGRVQSSVSHIWGGFFRMLENVTIAWLFCDVLQSEFQNDFLRLHNGAQKHL